MAGVGSREVKTIPAVAAALVQGGRILLVRRRYPPNAGLLALPGGKLEAGEDHAEAVVRELREETGIIARPGGFLETVEARGRASAGRPEPRYLIHVFAVEWRDGRACAGDDAEALVWLDREGLEAVREEVVDGALWVACRLLGQ